MSYAKQRPHPGPQRPRGTRLRAAIAAVRERALRGEPCYFWGRAGYEDCPGGWNWALPANDRNAFTAHHLHRVMDGGAPEPDARLMAPAHRGCNARDGLRAQNARRQGQHWTGGTDPPVEVEVTSRTW